MDEDAWDSFSGAMKRITDRNRVVLVNELLFEELVQAWHANRSVQPYRIEYGAPDEHGYYTPTVKIEQQAY